MFSASSDRLQIEQKGSSSSKTAAAAMLIDAKLVCMRAAAGSPR
jgi:hypothetical protein